MPMASFCALLPKRDPFCLDQSLNIGFNGCKAVVNIIEDGGVPVWHLATGHPAGSDLTYSVPALVLPVHAQGRPCAKVAVMDTDGR